MTVVTLTMTPADAILRAAQSAVGLAYPSPEYLDLVAPADVGARQSGIGTESGCGLTLLGVYRAAFVMPPPLSYVDGQAFNDVYRLAGGTPWTPGGALEHSTLATPPTLADAIVYWHHGNAPDHVDACVTLVVVNGMTCTLSAVAGGQRDAGNECVKLIERTLLWTRNGWQDSADGRLVAAVIRAAGMGARFTVRDQ